VPLQDVLLLSCAKPLVHPCPVSATLWGLNIHLVGSSAPWRSELIISPCVPIQHGTCPSGMILHISNYALHGLMSHKDHSNVNHISSTILLNMCIKSILSQLKSQRHYTSLQYKFGESDRASHWASVHWKRKVFGGDLI
jgi:hypothetical protein